jgi:hypothetical protein
VGDGADEVGKEGQTQPLCSDGGGEDLSGPDKGGRVNGLVADNVEE